ncbi:hypothetical protein BREVNS_1855 [Brevinematales bacterium NS]|nr:hypothetical protein BREVNS_1855 [Brevinematales bacterium NS]
MPLFPAFSVYRGLCVCFIQKSKFIYYIKEYFYAIFVFLLLS